MRDQSIDRIMTPDPIVIGYEESVADARKLFALKKIHHLPVVDEGKLVGILSSSDLHKLYLLQDHATATLSMTVDQIMHKRPVIIDISANLRDAAEILFGSGFHALPVVQGDREVVGIVTSSDLIDALLKTLPVGDGSMIQQPDEGIGSLVEENRRLRAVCDAAEHYIRSGMADREHTVLVQRLEEARRSDDSVAL
ncbi:MAG: CBS domain-containing protein [Woeseiaceae bacterium]|nr:CBS domain-containing protein [Woeseiaceae bacterium]